MATPKRRTRDVAPDEGRALTREELLQLIGRLREAEEMEAVQEEAEQKRRRQRLHQGQDPDDEKSTDVEGRQPFFLQPEGDADSKQNDGESASNDR